MVVKSNHGNCDVGIHTPGENYSDGDGYDDCVVEHGDGACDFATTKIGSKSSSTGDLICTRNAPAKMFQFHVHFLIF